MDSVLSACNRKLPKQVTSGTKAIVGTNDVNTPSSSYQAIIQRQR
jgi:hypothetical protein